MADERARYFRRLRRLRGSARRWSVAAGGLAGAAAILTPYAGLGLADAVWAGAAGASTMLAAWRWSDLRRVAARPAPPALDAAEQAARNRARLVSAVERLPVGAGVLTELRRQRTRFALRGSATGTAWERLDRASQTLAAVAGQLTGVAEPVLAEAAEARRTLSALVERTAGMERALATAPPAGRDQLRHARDEFMGQLQGGVEAYEHLVVAALDYVAQTTVPVHGAGPDTARLTEAGDLLREVAAALAELRAAERPISTAY
ncbi:phage shock envelope stress response protein PspM [Micromonosporaceae bacterium DT194]|uniref:phage shock envelope stress response protein PspM n=1 Tax=Melissospora conviva TaxID=3388432 RepID=UPI003C1EFEAF